MRNAMVVGTACGSRARGELRHRLAMPRRIRCCKQLLAAVMRPEASEPVGESENDKEERVSGIRFLKISLFQDEHKTKELLGLNPQSLSS